MVRLPEEEIDRAITLFNSMARDKLHDTHTETLERIIEAKRDHKAPSKVTEPEAEPS